MLQDHNLNIPEQDYRDLDLPSYSMLASISKQGIDVVNGVKNMNFVLKFGSLVDDMCFMPHTVKDKYHQGKAPKPPTANVKKVIDAVAEKLKKSSTNNPFIKSKKISSRMSTHKQMFLDECSKQGVYKSYNDEKTMKSLSVGRTYFKDKLESNGKVPISSEMWQLAAITHNTLVTHPFSQHLFNNNDGEESYYQFMFVAEVAGRKTKGMLDCVNVNHNTKTITPVDLKTGELPVEQFADVILLHKYYIQGGLYRKALINIVNNDPDLKGYTVAPFEFLYISKVNPYKPLIYVMPEKFYEASLHGFTDVHGFKHIGVYTLLKQYYYCKDTGNCTYPEEVVKDDGKVQLDNIIRQ